MNIRRFLALFLCVMMLGNLPAGALAEEGAPEEFLPEEDLFEFLPEELVCIPREEDLPELLPELPDAELTLVESAALLADGQDESVWATLQAALEEGGTVTLSDDVSHDGASGPIVIPSGVTAVLDLSGKTLDRALGEAEENGCLIINNGTLTITGGGTLKGGNNAGAGGAIVNNGKLTIESGTFTGNSASEGGAVYNAAGGELTINGGTFENNTATVQGGGIYVSGGTFSVSGSPVITGNTIDGGSTASDVYLPDGVEMVITGALGEDARIGITTGRRPTPADPVIVTDGLRDKGGKANFISNDSAFVADLNGNLDCFIAVPLHVILPADSEQGTVRITDVTGTPVTGDPPAYVLHYDIITIKVTPGEGVLLAENGLSATWTDGNSDPQPVELTQDQEENTWHFNMPEGDVTLMVKFEPDPAAGFTVIWLNGDGSELDRKTYQEGEPEPTTDKIPTKDADQENDYLFDKWDDGTVEGNVKTYAPLFTAEPFGGMMRFILRCYLEGLGRPAQEVLDDDTEGLDYWYNIMKEELLTPAQVANYFALSPESQGKYPDNESYVAMLYRMYMDRHYEQEGFDYWIDLLDSETLTRGQVNYYFGISDEFQRIVASFGLS